MDKKLLQQHALPTVEAYGYTTETLLRALDMDEFLPGPLGPPAKLLGGPRVSRRAIRAGRCLQLPPIAACSCMCSGACASCWAILCWGSMLTCSKHRCGYHGLAKVRLCLSRPVLSYVIIDSLAPSQRLLGTTWCSLAAHDELADLCGMRLQEPKQHEGSPSLQRGTCVRSLAELLDLWCAVLP